MNFLYLLFKSHSFTDCFLMLSCFFYHMLLISVSSYTNYTDRNTTLVILSHYTHFTLTLQLLYSHTPLLSLSSCTLNSIHFYSHTPVVAEHLSFLKFLKISDVRFTTCIILINSQKVIEDFRKRDFMVYRHGNLKVALYKISEKR